MWSSEPGSNRYGVKPGDFKSPVSANSTTRGYFGVSVAFRVTAPGLCPMLCILTGKTAKFYCLFSIFLKNTRLLA